MSAKAKKARWQELMDDAPNWVPPVLMCVGFSMQQHPRIGETHVGVYVDLRDPAARDWLIRLEAAAHPDTDYEEILGDRIAFFGVFERAQIRRECQPEHRPTLALPPPAGLVTVCAVGAVGHELVMAMRNAYRPAPDSCSFTPLPEGTTLTQGGLA